MLESSQLPGARLELDSGYRFRISFDHGRQVCVGDLAPPLGDGEGPEPIELLAASVGSCLASSFLYCARRARIEPAALEVEVRVMTRRNEEGRLRIGAIEAHLAPRVSEADRARLGACLERFESYCTVAESVRQGIPMRVRVEPSRNVPDPPRAEALVAVEGGGA